VYFTVYVPYSTVITEPMPSYIDGIQTSPADMDTVLLDMQKVSGSLGELSSSDMAIELTCQ
jgi:hypothetical protein